MGAFYGNVTLRGIAQDGVAGYLRSTSQRAYVSPTIRDITVVYAMRSVPEIAAELSKHFQCPALYAYVSDSDYLRYDLYDSGELLDEYFSDSWYNLPPEWDDVLHLSHWPSSGGDAALLCATFGVPDAVDAVEAVLRHTDPDVGPDTDLQDFWFGEDRHEYLVHALGLPIFASRLGFRNLEYGFVWPEAGDLSSFAVKT